MQSQRLRVDRQPTQVKPQAQAASLTKAKPHETAFAATALGPTPHSHSWSLASTRILSLGQANGPLEHEADRVANQVMRAPDSGRSIGPASLPSFTPAPLGTLWRKCACKGSGSECEECKKKETTLQRSSTSVAGPAAAPPIVHEVLRSPGQPLDAATRTFFEPRFGHDFSRVRVHTDARAAESARAVNALAYTVGRDVVFDAGRHAPQTSSGRQLLAHELTHVVQQQGGPDQLPATLKIGAVNDSYERQANAAAGSIAHPRSVQPLVALNQPRLQRDLARPPAGAPAPSAELTQEQIEAAINFNQDRFRDPYSIRVIRDVLGLAPTPATVDEALIRAVAEWQAARRLTQDGKVGHLTTRSIYLELVAEGEFRDAILLLMDSYQLPGDLRLHDVRVGNGPNCCGTPANQADAVTFGGPNCPPVGGPVNICFCQATIPRTTAAYDHFIRITGHELIHVPQCAAGTGDVNVDEFEAFFFEACSTGRAPQLSAADRVNHANIALGHFAAVPVALQTPARIAMRNRLNALVAAVGVGPC